MADTVQWTVATSEDVGDAVTIPMTDASLPFRCHISPQSIRGPIQRTAGTWPVPGICLSLIQAVICKINCPLSNIERGITRTSSALVGARAAMDICRVCQQSLIPICPFFTSDLVFDGESPTSRIQG